MYGYEDGPTLFCAEDVAHFVLARPCSHIGKLLQQCPVGGSEGHNDQNIA